ncbi:uncharacterized protein LOC118076731 [Zootoca vivipara]|uniref:uncharacterized protein LOC118076731 n=1 Tax=Zootoca vivipara TaxID=8524 RepID=UPI001591D95B|nr:uncharacterized protein LOC118076731 [Zootoca vivipara]XP_060136123.1 uncharacterized protein LOC118076731 [Zootoca vivipara]
MEKLNWLRDTDLCVGTLEIVACAVAIAVSVPGNILLIFCTRRCIDDQLRTSFTLIFSLAWVNLIHNLAVNVLKIVYASAVGLDSAGCKVLVFLANFTTSEAIWFTLYIALLYCFKLCRVVHPPVEAACRKHLTCHMVLISTLWVAGIAVSCPLLLYTGRTEKLYTENETSQQLSNVIYAECKTEYRNDLMEILYGKIFLVAIDLLPLLIMLLAGFRIVYLLWKHKMATCGGIWIGGDATELEVVRACKLILLLIFLIISLWVSYFSLFYCLKKFRSYYFGPPVLTVLSSGYSVISPYVLMLFNYKLIVRIRCFCCKSEKKLVTVSAIAPVSPYA